MDDSCSNQLAFTVLSSQIVNVFKMPHLFTHSEYADMVFVYGACNGSAEASCREYRRRFPNRRLPSPRVFTRVFLKLRETGSVPSRFNSERAIQQNLNEVEHILESVERSPSTSTRRISVRTAVPHVNVWRILHKEGLYPFHVQRVQHLEPNDLASRLEFCHWVNVNRQLIPSILFTDEATFTRDGINNTHNWHRWFHENPHAAVESNFQHRFSVNVWCGIINRTLLGPVILPQRLTGVEYLHFLQNELPMEDIPLNSRINMIFQHDGAPVHYSRQVTQYLNQTFPGLWIGRGGPIRWPPRSPDLTPLDFGLWGWLKNEVYQQKVNTRDELILRIMDCAARIKECHDVLQRTTLGVINRAEKCIEVGGGIFEPFL